MVPLIQTLNSKEIGRFARFLTIGLLGTLLDFGLLSLLKMIGLSTLSANSLSFSVGVVNNFTLNRLWTFVEARHADWHKQMGQFLMVSLAGLALNNIIIVLLEEPFGQLLGQSQFGYLPAKVIATSLVVFWNYFANRYWTFKILTVVQHE